MSDSLGGRQDNGTENFGTENFGTGGFGSFDNGFVPPANDAPPTQFAVPVQPGYPQPSYPPPSYPQPSYPQPPYPQPGGYYGSPMLRQQTSGMAVAGMVLGILSLVLFWASLLAPLLALLGIIFSSVGMSQGSKPGWTGKGMAIAGLVCSLITAAVWVLLVIAVASILA